MVGSSGSLLLHKLGPKIDAHAVVIRFNNAPTKDFEEHVGSKTSMRITSESFWGFQETPEEVVLVHSQSVDALRVSGVVGALPLVVLRMPVWASHQTSHTQLVLTPAPLVKPFNYARAWPGTCSSSSPPTSWR